MAELIIVITASICYKWYCPHLISEHLHSLKWETDRHNNVAVSWKRVCFVIIFSLFFFLQLFLHLHCCFVASNSLVLLFDRFPTRDPTITKEGEWCLSYASWWWSGWIEYSLKLATCTSFFFFIYIYMYLLIWRLIIVSKFKLSLLTRQGYPIMLVFFVYTCNIFNKNFTLAYRSSSF